MVNQGREAAAPFIVLLFNKSLASGYFPHDFKNAVVRTAEERCLGGRPDEELQTGLEFVVSFQAFGDSRKNYWTVTTIA